jgi:hypothetical protein
MLDAGRGLQPRPKRFFRGSPTNLGLPFPVLFLNGYKAGCKPAPAKFWQLLILFYKQSL